MRVWIGRYPHHRRFTDNSPTSLLMAADAEIPTINRDSSAPLTTNTSNDFSSAMLWWRYVLSMEPRVYAHNKIKNRTRSDMQSNWLDHRCFVDGMCGPFAFVHHSQRNSFTFLCFSPNSLHGMRLMVLDGSFCWGEIWLVHFLFKQVFVCVCGFKCVC